MRYDKERVVELLKQPRDDENVEELIKMNYGLMRKQLKRFHLVSDPDAISIAYEALYKAIMTFEPLKNNMFSTYASVCIYNALGSYIRILKNQIKTISYETPIEGDLALIDILESNDTADGRVLVDSGISDIDKAVSEALKELSNPLHRAIVDTWVESGFTLTHVKIAEKEGCTQSYVSQIIKRFKHSLKNKLEELKNV